MIDGSMKIVPGMDHGVQHGDHTVKPPLATDHGEHDQNDAQDCGHFLISEVPHEEDPQRADHPRDDQCHLVDCHCQKQVEQHDRDPRFDLQLDPISCFCIGIPDADPIPVCFFMRS